MFSKLSKRLGREKESKDAVHSNSENVPPPKQQGPSPEYTADAKGADFRAPPSYDEIARDMQSLAQGDPDETISVPMIHSSERKSFKDMLLLDSGKVQQTVIVRKLRRSHYLKHYAKDADGNYAGTEKPAPDAGLVFVPSKSTPEDIMRQVRQVAFGREHENGPTQGTSLADATGFGGPVGVGY